MSNDQNAKKNLTDFFCRSDMICTCYIAEKNKTPQPNAIHFHFPPSTTLDASRKPLMGVRRFGSDSRPFSLDVAMIGLILRNPPVSSFSLCKIHVVPCETKKADKDISEYRPYHCNAERGFSKTHPKPLSPASSQR